MIRRPPGRLRRRLAPMLLAAAVLGPSPPAAVAECAVGATSALPPPATDFLRGYRASFRAPARLAVDGLGRIYVADPARGAVVVRSADGRVLATGEELGRPVSVAVDAGGERIFVGDGADGRVTAYAADFSPLFDLGQGDGELAFPGDLALDPATGDVWVADSFAHRVEVYGPAGGRLFGFGGRGDAEGRFQFPMGIHVDAAADEVLVADQLNGRVQIFGRDGAFRSCLGEKGSGNGRFNMPQGIWADDFGRIYVADAFEGWVHVVDRQGATVAFLGDVGTGPGQLSTPTDLVIDPSGRLVVSSTTTARLEIFGLDGYVDPERFVPAEVDLDSEVLDPSAPQPVTAAIEVPGYRLELIEPATVAANGVAAAAGSAVIGDADGDHVPDLGVTFDGAALAATLPPEGGTVRLTGRLGELEIEGFGLLATAAGPGGDGDGDSIPDNADLCPGTAAGDPVDDAGCSLDQLCPCAGPAPGETWNNHGEYVACVAARVHDISHPPLSPKARGRLVKQAAMSSCGGAGVVLPGGEPR